MIDWLTSPTHTDWLTDAQTAGEELLVARRLGGRATASGPVLWNDPGAHQHDFRARHETGRHDAPWTVPAVKGELGREGDEQSEEIRSENGLSF